MQTVPTMSEDWHPERRSLEERRAAMHDETGTDRQILEVIRARVHDMANSMSAQALQLGLIQKDMEKATSAYIDHEARLRALEAMSPHQLVQQNDKDHESFRRSLEHIPTTFKKELAELKEEFVTRPEHEPVRKIVYGLVAAVLLTFVGGLLTLVFVSR